MTDKRSTSDAPELTPKEEEFARRAGRRLSDSSDTLDAATLSRLNQARQSALNELPDGRLTASHWWLPAGAVAVTATGIRGMVRLGIADVGDYLAAIAAVTPLLAAIRETDPLDAAVAAGLELAEFVSA